MDGSYVRACVCVCLFICLSICLSAIPSGAFCAARSRSPSPAFDSKGLKE